jgi:hypothetical protein
MTREEIDNALFLFHKKESVGCAIDTLENHLSVEVAEEIIDNLALIVNWFDTNTFEKISGKEIA